MNTLAVIPARYGSVRFPGKVLANRTGKPLVQHVVEQVCQANCVQRVLVATDDKRIAKAVEGFGGEAMMTGKHHPNGTSRIAEIVALLNAAAKPDIVLNVQADEPEIDPSVLDRLIEAMEKMDDMPMGTLAAPFHDGENAHDPNVVKVVCDQAGQALYFSRSLIPYIRDAEMQDHRTDHVLKHIGVYAYRPDFLLRYVKLTATPLEQAEKLEQLRAIEHGHRIAVVKVDTEHHGIDTPQQYDAFVLRYRKANPQRVGSGYEI